MLNSLSLYVADALTTYNHSSVWLHKPMPLRNPRVRLYCFPYAGGNASIFNSWTQISREVEISAISLPGRWLRQSEDAISCMQTICLELADAIRDDSDVPYAFFGHSMGGILAYLVAQELRTHGAMLPDHIFVSGCQAPHTVSKFSSRKRVDEMHPDELFGYISLLAGTPLELLADEFMRERIASAIVPDLIAIDNWCYVESKPLPKSITVFAGCRDPVVKANLAREWRRHTSCDFSFYLLNGDHFFINDEEVKILQIIKRILEVENLL